jgi:hypothetical protein
MQSTAPGSNHHFFAVSGNAAQLSIFNLQRHIANTQLPSAARPVVASAESICNND